MAATHYGSYVGNDQIMQSYTGTPTYGPYPDSNQLNIFGPIILPRIYGKDLTSFEIASSGSIAVTLSDIYSFDLSRNVADSNVILKTLNNDKLSFATSNDMTLHTESNMFMTALKSISATAKSNVNITASNDMNLIALNKLSINAVEFVLDMVNVDITGQSNVKISSTAGTTTVTSGANFVVAATSNIFMTASNDDVVVKALLGSATLSAGDDLFLSANSNIYATASNANMVLFADNFVNITSATEDVAIDAASNVKLTALAKNVTIVATVADVVVAAGRNMFASATDKVLLTASNANMEIRSLVGDTVVHAGSNLLIDAAKGISMQATVSNISLSAGGAVSLTATALPLTLTTSTNDVIISSAKDVKSTAANDMLFTAKKIQYVATTSSINLTAAQVFEATAGATATVFAPNMVTIKSADTSYFTVAPTTAFVTSSNVTMGDINLAKFKVVGESANATLTVAASNSVKISGSNAIESMSTNHFFKTMSGATNMVSIQEGAGPGGSNLITINGSLDVVGMINSVSVTEQTLEIADKYIVLAHNSNISETIVDGVLTNNSAGLMIAGMPSAITDQSVGSNIASFEKSIKWYNGSGGMADARSNVSSEPFWEVKGGGIRITSVKPTNNWASEGVVTATDMVSYTFRVNERKGLELVRTVDNGAGGLKYDRMVVFGMQRTDLL